MLFKFLNDGQMRNITQISFLVNADSEGLMFMLKNIQMISLVDNKNVDYGRADTIVYIYIVYTSIVYITIVYTAIVYITIVYTAIVYIYIVYTSIVYITIVYTSKVYKTMDV
jgi:hypothetical protein